MTNWTKEQQQAIFKTGNNIIVSAGAGSGKTAVLTERVITKLKSGIHLSNLIILTFTNAAASEMKERIQKKIKEAINDGYNLKNELEYIDQAIICTFDAYALYLLKKYSDVINIDSNISIGDNIVFDIELDKIVNDIFDKKYEECDEAFISLINDYTVKDDVNIKNMIKTFYKSLNNIYNKKEYLENYIEANYDSKYINNLISDYIILIKSCVNNIKQILNSLSNIEELEYLEKLNEYLADLITLKNYDDFKEYISDISSMPRLPKNASSLLKKSKEKIKKQLDKIKNLCKYENIDEIIDTINLTKKYMVCIIDILKSIFVRMDKYKSKNNIYEFIDIASLSIDLLKNNEQIRLDIKSSINEIMIDEYQDTNDIQDIFISLISNNNVYMVGDVKQSIYRFRNANPKLFMAHYNDYSKNIGGIKIDLIKNFRSREEVLNNINEIFDRVMDEQIGGASYKESHRLVFGNDVYTKFKGEDYNLEIYNYDSSNGKKEEIEAFIIARDIKTKIENKYQVYDFDLKTLRNVEYKDFAILIDRSKQFDLYRKIFEYMHIPLCVHKNDSFIHSDEMYTILNLLKIVYSHIDSNYKAENIRHSFISVARSFLFDYSDDDIANVLLDDDIIESISNESSMFYNIYYTTKKISDNLDYMSLYEVIDELYNSYNIREKISKLSNYNNINVKLDYLLSKTSELGNIGYNLLDFINYIDNVINDEDKDIEFKSNDNNDESVSIMTIHASKGLEFNICYYPEIYREFSKNDVQKTFLYSKRYGFIIPYFNQGIDNTILLDLVKDDKKCEEISERLRLFYVALTRAKQKMIILVNDLTQENMDDDIIVPNEKRLEYKSFRDVLESISGVLEKYIKDVDVIVDRNYKNLVINKVLNKKSDKKIIHNIINLKSELEENTSFSKKIHALNSNDIRKSIEYGKVVHKYFEVFDLNNKVVRDFNDKLKQIGVDLENSKRYFEYEFIYKDSNIMRHGIIDLLIDTKDKCYIIDYKLKNIDSSDYVKQLQGYKNYIESKLNKNVTCYLYSILDNALEKLI